jgi:hypothetical protein
MPATSQEPSGRFGFAAESKPAAPVDERGCRRDIRSNGWIVVRGVRSGKPVRQKKQVFFVRCGSVVRNFIGLPSRKMKSDPDVFADALVRIASAAAAWQVVSPNHSQASGHPRPLGRWHWCAEGGSAHAGECRGGSAQRAPMVIIWRNRRVNRILRPACNPRQTATSSI